MRSNFNKRTKLARPLKSLMSGRLTSNFGSGFRGILKAFPGASAGYSLRRIGSGPVVRLRRGSDSTESDFVAADLVGSVTGAELIAEPNFASSTGWGINSGGGWVISGGTATLTSTAGNDFLSSDAVADHDYYLMTITIDSCSDFGEAGLRIASGNYRPFSDFGITTAGTYTFMVDRAYNDLTALARFFEQGDAGISCVLSQCSLKPYTPSAAEQWAMNVTSSFYPWQADGSFDAYATTWYDQSGTGNDATQTTAAAQPKLITAGVTELDNGKPALVFDGVDDTLVTASPILSTMDEVFVSTVSGDVVAPAGANYRVSLSKSPNRMYVPASTATATRVSYVSSNPIEATGNPLTQQFITLQVTDTLATGFSDGIKMSPKNDAAAVTNAIVDPLAFGSLGLSSFSNCMIQEAIAYDFDQSANRIGIEENIASGWCMPYPTQPLVSENMPEPAGAYSLRSLTGSSSTNVVRLRRASDSTESDFTEGELAGTVTGSERAVNGDFATGDLTGWNDGPSWSVNGSDQLECDGTQASRDQCTQTSICPSAGDTNYYRVSFDIISCSDFTDAGIRLASTGFNTCEFSDMGITSAGSYSLLINTSLCTTQKFDIFCQAGVTLVIDNVSMVEYEPSVAELWAYEGPNSVNGFSSDGDSDATATTWYDQSNEDSGREIVGTGGSLVESDWVLNGPNAVFSNGQIDLYRDDERLDLAEPHGTATYVGTPIKAGHVYATDITYDYNGTDAGGYGINVGDDATALWGSAPADSTPTVDGTVIFQNINSKDSHFTITALSVRDVTNDATQATAAAQPKLITAGVTEQDNGKPALVFDGVDDHLDAVGLATANGAADTSVFVGRLSTTGSQCAFLDNVSGDPHFIASRPSTPTSFGVYFGSTVDTNYGTVNEEQNVHFIQKSSISSSSYGSLNGVTDSVDGGTGGYTDGVRIGMGRDAVGLALDGNMQEVIIYPSDQSANRKIIETNINAHYSIYYGDDWNDFNNWSDTQTWED